jgi:hypothetical protein
MGILGDAPSLHEFHNCASFSLLSLSERERENFNHAVFALAFFSRRQDRELLGAISRGLLDCPVEFKVHRLRDGFSVGNALLLGQPLPQAQSAAIIAQGFQNAGNAIAEGSRYQPQYIQPVPLQFPTPMPIGGNNYSVTRNPITGDYNVQRY